MFALSSLVAGRMVVLSTPELAHEVLHASPGTYLAGAANRRILPVLPEDTVLTLDGEPHLQRRHRLARFFHGDALEALVPAIREITSREIADWPPGVPFAVLPRMRLLSLSVASRLILGVSDQALVSLIESHLARALRPYAMLAGHRALRHLRAARPQAAARRGRHEFGRGLSEVLRAGSTTAESPASALEEVGTDQLLALMLAGQETTATALAWAIYELARAPQLVERLSAEQGQADRPWLEAVISETLRFRPPLIDIVREPTEPVRLGGRDIAAGTLLLIPPPLIHLQGRQPDGDEFSPGRFLRHHPDPHTWLPFGGGDRRCLGAPLAMLELREVLPKIVERFELRPARSIRERPRLYGTALVPARGAEIVLASRDRSASGGLA